MTSPNLSEIVTTTLRNRSGKLADNYTNNNAIMYRLNEKGRVKTFDGGRTIVEELAYQENGTYTRYSGYQEIDISPSDVITGAEFEIKQAAVSVSISGLEQLQNSGRSAIIDLLEGRIDNAEGTMMNNLSSDMYSDGTADGGKQMGGLQLLVADTGLSTAGGINSSTFSFWRNQIFDASTTLSTAISASNIQTAMNKLWLACARGRDVTDLIIMDNNYYEFYWSSLQTIQRFVNEKMAAAGFDNLKFKQSDVVYDGGQGGAAPTNHAYFLNSDYLKYRPHAGRNMVPLDPDRFSTNQDAMIKLIGWAGNMCASNRALQGVIVE